jgi:hypothetical protein
MERAGQPAVHAAIVAMVMGTTLVTRPVAQGTQPRGVTAAGGAAVNAGATGYFFVAVDCFAMIWPLIFS